MNGQLYINGQFVDAGDGATFEVVNPYTREVIGKHASATAEDVKRAIACSAKAFQNYRQTTAYQRADQLRKLHQLVLDNLDVLAETMTREQGKPISEARAEVRYAASYLQWYAEEGIRVRGDLLPSNSRRQRMRVLRQPVGPVALITPWNFPLAMFARKLAPALAAGCTVILKPARLTPLTAVKFFELVDQAGFEDGVCQLLNGKASLIGDILMEDFRIRKLSFTGSTKVGIMLAEKAAATMKRVSLELGGHAPYLVFDDADIARAIKGILTAKFRNAGQVCIAANRVYVQQSIKEQFEKELLETVSQLKVGDGFDDVDIGPIIDQEIYDKIASHVEDATQKGANLLYGGEGYRLKQTSGGYFYPPTLLNNVDDTMKISNEETFGPVIPLYSFQTEEEGLALANNTRYGLVAYAYTQDLARATRVYEALEFGMVGINTPQIGSAQAPFGGIKMSGYGREGGYYGIEDYLSIKYVNIGI